MFHYQSNFKRYRCELDHVPADLDRGFANEMNFWFLSRIRTINKNSIEFQVGFKKCIENDTSFLTTAITGNESWYHQNPKLSKHHTNGNLPTHQHFYLEVLRRLREYLAYRSRPDISHPPYSPNTVFFPRMKKNQKKKRFNVMEVLKGINPTNFINLMIYRVPEIF